MSDTENLLWVKSVYTMGLSENQCNLLNTDSKYVLCEWIPDTFDE